MEDQNNSFAGVKIQTGALRNDLMFQSRTLHARLRAEGQTMRMQLSLEPGMIGVLSMIALNPGISQNDLAASMVLKKSAVTALVKELEARGLLDRVRQDSDRRLNALTLTDRGQALVARVRVMSEAVNERLLDGIPEADCATFFRVLGTVIDRLVDE